MTMENVNEELLQVSSWQYATLNIHFYFSLIHCVSSEAMTFLALFGEEILDENDEYVELHNK